MRQFVTGWIVMQLNERWITPTKTKCAPPTTGAIVATNASNLLGGGTGNSAAATLNQAKGRESFPSLARGAQKLGERKSTEAVTFQILLAVRRVPERWTRRTPARCPCQQGSRPQPSQELPGSIDSGVVRGPRIFTVGEPLWTAVPVYIRDYLAANHIRMDPVSSPADAVSRVRDLANRGADGIKLFTGSLQRNGRVTNMPLNMVRAAAAAAHGHGLPVFAHPQNDVGLNDALRGGVDILAHTVPDSPPWTPAFVSTLTAAHIALIPTLTLFDVEARKENASDAEREAWIGKMVAELRAFVMGGGEVLFGTDVGYIDHFDTSLEYELMGRAGMSFAQILASLTTNPARRFHAERSGRVAVGMSGDLVILDDDPSVDVRALSSVAYVIRAGRITYSTRSAHQ